MKKAEGAIAKRLEIWRTAQYYDRDGSGDQHLMHPCAGWYFRRNILVINLRENVNPSQGALNATPCPLVPSSRNS